MVLKGYCMCPYAGNSCSLFHLKGVSAKSGTDLCSLLPCACITRWCLLSDKREATFTYCDLDSPVVSRSFVSGRESQAKCADCHTQGEGAGRTKITFLGTNHSHLNYSFDRVMDLADETEQKVSFISTSQDLSACLGLF